MYLGGCDDDEDEDDWLLVDCGYVMVACDWELGYDVGCDWVFGYDVAGCDWFSSLWGKVEDEYGCRVDELYAGGGGWESFREEEDEYCL